MDPRKWLAFLRAKGVCGSLEDVVHQTIGSQPFPWVSEYEERFVGARVVEIGGPSWMFSSKGRVPIYPLVAHLDLVDFAADTIWHPRAPGFRGGYLWPAGLGVRFIEEATDLRSLGDDRYDAFLASHVLEHSANPIQALLEWRRVIREGGYGIVVVPNKARTFDHRRPTTTVDHMVSDYRKGVAENDRTHFPEVLELHDLRRDPDAGSRDAFIKRLEENPRFRGLHHHVFDAASLAELSRFAGFTLLERGAANQHIVVLLQKG